MDIKKRIINACQEMAEERGFRAMTVDDLCARAGISKRTLYRYFRSKDELIEATVESFMLEMSGEIASILQSQEEPGAIIGAVVKTLATRSRFITGPLGLNDIRQYYPHLWQRIDDFRVARLGEILEVILGQGDKTIDNRIVIAVITAAVQAVLTPDFILKNNLTFEETANHLVNLLIKMLL